MIAYRSCHGEPPLRFFFSKNLFGSSEEKERREKKERRAKDVVIEILLDVVMEKNSLEEKLPCRHRSVHRAPRHGLLLLQREVAPAAAQRLVWTARSPRSPTR
jgi:hypothetical protein